MPSQSVDYDTIAASYDRRFVHDQSDHTLAALLSLQRECGARRMLETGCGTGHWLASLRRQAKLSKNLELHGLDLSGGMLAKAQTKSANLELVQGQAGYLPYGSGLFDLVFCVNAIHHFTKPRRFVQEARRVLENGGTLAVVGTDPRGHHDDWYIYQYFPGTYENDLARFPSWGAIMDWMVASGFQNVSLRLAGIIHDPKAGAEVLDDPFLEKNATSQLTLLSEESYQNGLGRMRAAIAGAEKQGQQLVFPCDIHVHVLSAECH